MKVLVADDNDSDRRSLLEVIAGCGWEGTAVADGEAAWSVLAGSDPPRIVLLDWVGPRVGGPAVCRRMRQAPRPEPTYVIALTAGGGADAGPLAGGADDFVAKPVDPQELAARLRAAHRILDLRGLESVIFSFARAVDEKNPYTRGHSERVRRVALALAERLGLPAAEADRLRRGAALHDIGMIAVPDALLNSAGPLASEQYDLIKRHPERGAQMLEGVEPLRDLVPLVRWHHERLDGRGYPDGLSGSEVPALVRVLSVADVYDALSCDRSYRPGMPHDVCLGVLRKNAAGGGLDPELVEQFCAIPPHLVEPQTDIGSGSRTIPPSFAREVLAARP
ncbi:MAG: HD domain-containing phosphohydrolase [Gemmata sp.]